MTEASTCPFCGLRAWTSRMFDASPERRVRRNAKSGQEHEVLAYGKHVGYKVECSVCNARIERTAIGAKKIAQAKIDVLDAWAARAPVAANTKPSPYGLLPCPCCGGEPAISFTDNTKRQPDERFGRVNMVTCSRCGLEIIGLQLRHVNERTDYVRVDAVAAWNARSV